MIAYEIQLQCIIREKSETKLSPRKNPRERFLSEKKNCPKNNCQKKNVSDSVSDFQCIK